MTEPTSFKSHNFDAVNQQILQIAKREKARIFAYRLKSFQTIFLYVAIAALIIAFLILATAWAKRIISAPYYPPRTEIVRPEIIEREVIKVVQVPVEQSILERSNNSYDGPRGEESNSSSAINCPVVTYYHTFKTASATGLESSGIDEVVTGWKYEDSDSKFPERQFCYVMKSTPGKSTTIRVTLATINENGEFINNIDSSVAREASVTQAELNKALQKCQWAST